jgi:hypothetical protein
MNNKNQVFMWPAAPIGPRPNDSIQVLTSAATQNAFVPPGDLMRVLDYMTFLEMKAALVDGFMVQTMKLPELVEHARRLSFGDTEPAPITKYNVDGHVCGETKRKAMTVSAVLELMKDDPDSVRSFTYDAESGVMGLDPWRLVDGINPMVNEPKSELWFDNGGSRIVDNTSILYVQQPKKKK